MSSRRSWKHQEFVAHGSKVTCAALGKKSGRVLATGGEDMKVNMWSVDKPNCIMSLSGHQTPIACVRFGPNEDLVVAGSQSGSLKVWDLNQAKIVRTLTGHKAAVKSLDFFPYGEYLASAAVDSLVKLWDLRRKGCIMTYQGHSGPVNSLKFSPDARWLVSASDDTTVRLWDLSAGKELRQFSGHYGPVNQIEYHPSEYLLASGSNDRTVNFWDLEKFALVSASEAATAQVRAILFHPDGEVLFSATQDYLHVFSWEPSRTHDTLVVGWGKVADIAISQDELLGISYQQGSVQVHIVDLKQVAPFGVPPPPTRGNASNVAAVSPEPQRPIRRPPTGTRRNFVRSASTATKPFCRLKEETEGEAPSADEEGNDITNRADIRSPEEYRQVFQQPVKPKSNNAHRNSPAAHKPAADLPSMVGNMNLITQEFSKPSGLNVADFLPKSDSRSAPKSARALCAKLQEGHLTMVQVFTSRLHNLEVVRAMWSPSSIRVGLTAAIDTKDQAILVDILDHVLNHRTQLWNLEVCALLVPHLKNIVGSKYDAHVRVGCDSLKIILKNFGDVIKSSVGASSMGGVDLSREERIEKCRICLDHLLDVRRLLEEKKSQVSGKLSNTFRELKVLIDRLDC